MRLGRMIAILCLAGSGTLLVEAGNQGPPPRKEITYSKEVAPILYKNCIVCHRPNDIAPMSLMTYNEVLPFARMIQASVVQRKMPPWHADPAFGEFTNDSRLSEEDIATIDAWAKGGAKPGEATLAASASELSQGW